MPLSSSKSHFSTCPLALEVEMTSRSCTISPSLLFMWVISSTSVNNTLAMPSKHFFRWGCTLVERNARKVNHSKLQFKFHRPVNLIKWPKYMQTYTVPHFNTQYQACTQPYIQLSVSFVKLNLDWNESTLDKTTALSASCWCPSFTALSVRQAVNCLCVWINITQTISISLCAKFPMWRVWKLLILLYSKRHT